MEAPVLDRASLVARVAAGLAPRFVFFWGHTRAPGEAVGAEVLSQWFEAPFEVEGIRYPTAEHYMMAEKARCFGDHEVREQVLSAPDPARAKALGRQVRGFVGPTWDAARFEVVVAGNRAKFGQNPRLGAFLDHTGDAVLVEASPVDLIWGIGHAAHEPDAARPEAWRGLNLLGFALMQVRHERASQSDLR